ncbi:hypothetical protein [Alteromonas sp. A079]|uniref:hypothetical protein n=1 Tax=Alteromonas sp. A079 TaxID=3410268 RepID=UPI003B9DF7C3
MTIKDYNRYRKAILGAVALVITLMGIGIYFVTNEKEEAFNNTAPSTDASDSTIEPKNYRLMTAPLTPDRTANALENATKIYSASESYSQCEVENAEVWDKLQRVKNAINSELLALDNSRLLSDAVFLLQEEGYFDTSNALLNLHRLQLTNQQQKFQRAPFKPTQEEIDEIRNAFYLLQDIVEAAAQQDIEKVMQATHAFRQNNDKHGYAIRRGRNKFLITPDVVIGHSLATASPTFVDDIAAQYPVSHLLFTQAVRSGASNEVLEKLLSSFDFNNEPIYTKHNTLQTALQAAIEIESLHAMRLLLSQPNLQHTAFFFNPLNTIIFNTLNAKKDEFTEIQKAMMTELGEHGFRVDIVSTSYTKNPMLAGYIAMLERPIVDQLKGLSILPHHIDKLQIHPDSTLPLYLQDQLKRNAFQARVLKDEYNERAKTCVERKKTLQSLVPPLTSIDDVFVYINADNSFTENVQLLKQQSLTLVDAYYEKMGSQSLDTRRVDAIAASTESLKDIPFDVLAQINELNPFERYHLTERYCQKFGKRSMDDIFNTVQYINFSVFSFEACLAGSPDDYADTERYFYHQENTYPGIIYNKLAHYAVDEAIEALSDPAFQRPKDYSGYPHGRDALMLALDIKLATHNIDKKDYKTLISALIEKPS